MKDGVRTQQISGVGVQRKDSRSRESREPKSGRMLPTLHSYRERDSQAREEACCSGLDWPWTTSGMGLSRLSQKSSSPSVELVSAEEGAGESWGDCEHS